MPWGILLAFALVFCLGIGALRFSTVVNPLSLFSGIWLVVVALYQLRLSGLQAAVAPETYQLLFVMVVSFLIAFCLFSYFRISSPSSKKLSLIARDFPLKKIIFHFKIWATASAIEIVYSGGIPIVWTLVGSSKTYFDFGIPSLHGLLAAYGLAITLISFQKIVSGKYGKDKGRLIAIVSSICIFYLLIISRQVVMSAIIEMVAVLALNRRHIPWIKLFGIGLVTVLAFGLVGNFRSGYESFMGVARINSSLPEFLSGFYWVYVYLTMTIANINNMVGIGLSQLGFEPILKTFVPTVLSDMVFSGTTAVNPSYLVDINFNVSGFLAPYYEGFGLVGVAGGAALYGAVAGFAYRRYIERPCEYTRLLYAISIEIVMLSFFTDMLLYLPNGFQFVIIWWLYRSTRSLESSNALNPRTETSR